MLVFRDMAEDLCQSKLGRRWRWTVRAIAREQGWTFADAFAYELQCGIDELMRLSTRRSPLMDKLES